MSESKIYIKYWCFFSKPGSNIYQSKIGNKSSSLMVSNCTYLTPDPSSEFVFTITAIVPAIGSWPVISNNFQRCIQKQLEDFLKLFDSFTD